MTMLSDIVNNLQNRASEYFGLASKPEIGVIENLNHSNSRTARLSVLWNGGGTKLFVKMLYPDEADGKSNRSDREYKKGQIRAEYGVLKNLHQAFASFPDLGVVKPIACFPEYLALVTEEQEGIKLSSIMGNAKLYSPQSRIDELADRIYLCGRWLQHFQRLIGEEGNRRYDFNEVFEYCEVRLHRLGLQRPDEFTDSFRARVRSFLRERVDHVQKEELRVVGRHNDFGPNNIIVSGQKLVVLDFSGFGYGPPCCDYVKFWSELDLMRTSPLILNKTVEKLQEAMVDGYGERIDTAELLFVVFRVAYVLDKMDDVWLDWADTPWAQRLAYKQLYLGFLSWLKKLC